MVEFSFTTVPGKIGRILEKVRSTGVPTNVDTNWLKRIGFTSSNDKSLLPILRQIGFVNGKSPTALWSKYRGGDNKKVLGEAIRNGYAALYDTYDDAHQRTSGELTNVFSAMSTAGAQAISKTVSTFKALVAEAEFDQRQQSDIAETAETTTREVEPHTAQAPAAVAATRGVGGTALHLNIQIHISPEASPQQIEAIFSSMAKHLNIAQA